MINLEIKVVAPNIEEIKNKAIEIDALNKGILNQTDTYFLTGMMRLKLREEKDKNYIVYYVRSNKKDSKLSKYYILNIPNILLVMVKNILSLIFGTKVVVNKKRELFIYKNTRIHFDIVENLGNYIELETMLTKTQKEEDLKQEHNFVIQSLGLNTLEKISDSYSDLLIHKNQK